MTAGYQHLKKQKCIITKLRNVGFTLGPVGLIGNNGDPRRFYFGTRGTHRAKWGPMRMKVSRGRGRGWGRGREAGWLDGWMAAACWLAAAGWLDGCCWMLLLLAGWLLLAGCWLAAAGCCWMLRLAGCCWLAGWLLLAGWLVGWLAALPSKAPPPAHTLG